MSIATEERGSDSLYIESITRGLTLSDGSAVRPAESRWHLVVVKHQSRVNAIVVGPWTTTGVVFWGEGAEVLWIKFKLGTFMPGLTVKRFLNVETTLPGAASHSFWLNGSAWTFPDIEDVDTFVNRLARDGVLVRDPVVSAALQGEPQALSPRALRHRFLQATGLSQGHIQGIRRAERAAALLEQGTPIADVVFQAGYYDQPHLTRSLKQLVGYTPAQLSHAHEPDPLAVSYKTGRGEEIYPVEEVNTR